MTDPAPPSLIDLELQEQVARKLLEQAAAVAAAHAAAVAKCAARGITDPLDAPNEGAIAYLEARTTEVRQRWEAWHRARTALGDHRKADRRQT